MQKTIIVIPARLESTRLERKLLRDLDGKSIIERTFEQASKASLADEVHIACDHQELVEHCKSFTENVHLTSAEHQSGTDRIAELALKNNNWQIIVNVQGDEPFINPNDIDKAIEPFVHDPKLEMTSLYHQLENKDEINNPNNVKVVTDSNDTALYFSRLPIPFVRETITNNIVIPNEYEGPQDTHFEISHAARNDTLVYKKHIGLYCYRREALLALSSMKQTPLELSEKLEQLRALENGISIKMIQVDSAPIGIDTEEDLAMARRMEG